MPDTAIRYCDDEVEQLGSLVMVPSGLSALHKLDFAEGELVAAVVPTVLPVEPVPDGREPDAPVVDAPFVLLPVLCASAAEVGPAKAMAAVKAAIFGKVMAFSLSQAEEVANGEGVAAGTKARLPMVRFGCLVRGRRVQEVP